MDPDRDRSDEEPAEEWQRSDTSRLIAFSDAVFAIVITLLVLDLRTPEVGPGKLSRALFAQWPAYLAYLTSYLYVAVNWLNHKAAFRRVRCSERGLHWVNLAILFSTALVPFATAVVSRAVQLGSHADERTAVICYAGVGALLCLSWLYFAHYLGRHPELLEEGVEPSYFQSDRVRPMVGVVLYLVAGLIGVLVNIPAALAIFLVLPLFYGLTSNGLYDLRAVSRRRWIGR